MKKKLVLLLGIILSCNVYATANAANLVVNGEFEAGLSGFESDYTYTSDPNKLYSGRYILQNSAGTGNYILANGSHYSTDAVWRQTITSLTPDTNYVFSIWAAKMTVFPYPVLDLRVNGSSIGNFVLDGDYAVLENLAGAWNSGTLGSAVLSIHDLNTTVGGNNFAFDYVSFDLAPVAPAPAPEPSTMILGLLGTGSLIGLRKRKF